MAYPDAIRDAAASDLAAGIAVSVVAKRHDIGERSLRRWIAEDRGFQEQVNALRGEVVTAVTGRLCRLATKATRRLSKLLDSHSENIQLAAVRVVLDGASRLREVTDLGAEIAELRRQVQQRDEQLGPRPAREGHTA